MLLLGQGMVQARYLRQLRRLPPSQRAPRQAQPMAQMAQQSLVPKQVAQLVAAQAAAWAFGVVLAWVWGAEVGVVRQDLRVQKALAAACSRATRWGHGRRPIAAVSTGPAGRAAAKHAQRSRQLMPIPENEKTC